MAVTLWLLVALGATAAAHSGIQSYVYVSLTDSSVDGRVEYPVGDLGEVLGIDFPEEPAAIEEVALANADRIRAYTAEHLAMGDDTGEWELAFEADPTVLGAAGGYVQVPFTVERSFDGAPRSFRVDYDGIIHANPERDALFLVENDWGTARFDNEGDHLLGFSVGLTSQAIELDDVGTLESIGAARGLGTDAVRDGVDHLLFVVAVVLVAVWMPTAGAPAATVPSVPGAIRRAVVLLGIALLAGSAVLWVVGLTAPDWSSDLVGSLVAASLLAMAVYARWRVPARPGIVVAALGAVQGLGYGQAYLDVRLDRLDTPLTLVAFDLGVIVAVVTIAVLVLPLVLALQRTRLARIGFPALAVALAAYATAWLIERIGGVDLPVERVATPLTVWPRNLWIVFAAWVATGALLAWTSSRRRQPTSGTGEDEQMDRDVPAVTP